MKKLFFGTLFFIGCGTVSGPAIITSKEQSFGRDCLCTFDYTGLGHGLPATFEDSCDKYNVGDTIVGRKRLN
jgi:hypothetical protein